MVGMFDIDLSSVNAPLGSHDRNKIQAHVVTLEDEGFFDAVPNKERDSLKERIALRVYGASMVYHLHRSIDQQLATNADVLSDIKIIAKAIDTISQRLAHLRDEHLAEYLNINDTYLSFVADARADTDERYFQIRKEWATFGVPQFSDALAKTFRYWLHKHRGRHKRGAPASHHDRVLIQRLVFVYELVPGKKAGVSAPPGGKAATGPFVRFLEGWLNVLDPDRKTRPSKSFIQGALTEYREAEKEMRNFILDHSTDLGCE